MIGGGCLGLYAVVLQGCLGLLCLGWYLLCSYLDTSCTKFPSLRHEFDHLLPPLRASGDSGAYPSPDCSKSPSRTMEQFQFLRQASSTIHVFAAV